MKERSDPVTPARAFVTSAHAFTSLLPTDYLCYILYMSKNIPKEVPALIITGLTLTNMGIISVVTAVHNDNNFTLGLAVALIVAGSILLGAAVKKSLDSK